MNITTGVLGATEGVGQWLVSLLDSHPEFELTVVTAETPERNTRKSYGETVSWTVPTPVSDAVRALDLKQPDAEEIASDVDILFSALPTSLAKQIEPLFAEQGCFVCSTVRNDRLADDTPLVIPEVNPGHIELLEYQRANRRWDGGIVKNPSAPVATIALPLASLPTSTLKKANLTTFQGHPDTSEDQVSAIDVINNVVPEVAGEESRIVTETQKVLGTYDGEKVQPHKIRLSPSCNLVPMNERVLVNMWIETTDEIGVTVAESMMREFKPVDLPSSPTHPLELFLVPDRPQPRLDATHETGQRVAVGPVGATSDGLKFDCSAHSAIRGAAGTSLLNAELLVEKEYV